MGEGIAFWGHLESFMPFVLWFKEVYGKVEVKCHKYKYAKCHAKVGLITWNTLDIEICLTVTETILEVMFLSFLSMMSEGNTEGKNVIIN